MGMIISEATAVDAAYLSGRFDAVQDMFNNFDFVSIDMVAIVLGLDLGAYKARQAKIMGEGVENDVD